MHRLSIRRLPLPAGTTAQRWIVALAILVIAAADCGAQQNQGSVPSGSVHYLLNADMPPGALGQSRLMRRGPVHAYYQPVQIYAPEGASVSMADGYGFTQPVAAPIRVGMQVGAVYRLLISGLPEMPGVEIYPSVEIIDRTYPPPGQAALFPIPVHIDRDDIAQALAGRLVTRVVYLEDPQTALPLPEEAHTQRSLEIRPDMDPLQEADRLGRPVAVLRIGSRVPPNDPAQLQHFLLGNPPWLSIPDVPTATSPEPQQ
jgi:hypothetical protein